MAFSDKIKNCTEILYFRSFCHWGGKLRFKKFGKGSYIVKPLRIKGGREVVVGKNVSILHHLRIEVWKKDPLQKEPCIEIGDGTNIEQSVHITAGERVVVGKQCSILGGSVITDIVHPYDDPHCPASSRVIICNPVNIGNQCFIGMHSMIMPGVTLGEHAVVGANSVVTHDVDAYTVVAGIPARVVRKYDFDSGKWEKV